MLKVILKIIEALHSFEHSAGDEPKAARALLDQFKEFPASTPCITYLFR